MSVKGVIFPLKWLLHDNPSWWQNFTTTVRDSWLNGDHSVIASEILNRELLEYGAKYWEGPLEMGGPFVSFDEESEAIRFILKWS